MFRELAKIVLAIQLSAPTMPAVQAEAYAKIIKQQAEVFDIDPLLTVSVAKHESRWNPMAISSDHLDYGLMQIRCGLAYKAPCQDLFNPETNIRMGTYLIAKNRDFCRKWLKREPTIT
jgi:soluble lytic murein transglycosylase-like protein